MFCITGIFKCFTPHEDARRATSRLQHQLRSASLFILIFLSSLSLSLSLLFFYFLSAPPALLLCLVSPTNLPSLRASFAGAPSFLPLFLSLLPIPLAFVSLDKPSKCAPRNCRSRLHSPRGRTTVITEEGKFLFNARFLPIACFPIEILFLHAFCGPLLFLFFTAV